MRNTRFFSVRAAAVLTMLPMLASAASFPDVPSSYPHSAAVLRLADLGVIGGNPDGTFKPYDPVDRASMLKMLYKAAGKTADVSKTKCFPDVVAGSWYENIVCDAVAKGYVQGYDNGASFKPGRAVTRAEALKLSIAVFGIAQAEGNAGVYTDVTAADWFMPYVRTALGRKILPIAGQEGPVYRPNMPLERGQAAAYIWNALAVKPDSTSFTPASSSSSSQGRASAMTERDRELAEQRANEQKSLALDMANMYRQSFPFSVAKTFSGKHSLSFRFVASSTMTADFTATLGAKGAVTCRLYRLMGEAISNEYYLGMQDGQSCHLRATLVSGEYQLDVQGTVADAGVTVTGVAVKGDGNDGFSEAKPLETGKIRLDALEANDLDDWYSFTVTHSTSITEVPGQNRTVTVTATDKLGCIIFPLDDVDLFGFDSPLCNENFLYPTGTYLINIRHAAPRAARQTYSIQVK